jgi:hypothetical protein
MPWMWSVPAKPPGLSISLRSCGQCHSEPLPNPSPRSRPTQTVFKCSMHTSWHVEPTSSCGTNNRITPYKGPSTNIMRLEAKRSLLRYEEKHVSYPLFACLIGSRSCFQHRSPQVRKKGSSSLCLSHPEAGLACHRFVGARCHCDVRSVGWVNLYGQAFRSESYILAGCLVRDT